MQRSKPWGKSCPFTLTLLALLALSPPTRAFPFPGAEPRISPSPATARELPLQAGHSVQDLDVSPLGPQAAILTTMSDGSQSVRLWDLHKPASETAWTLPAGLRAQSLAWHPVERKLFLLGTRGNRSVILRVDERQGAWKDTLIHADSRPLRRLAACPRPFLPAYADDASAPEYRIFFGRKDSGGYSIRSIRENGAAPYQAIGKASGILPPSGSFESPSDLVAPSALPLGFHPAGNILWWEDAKSCFHRADYGDKLWISQAALKEPGLCGGSVTSTPNGLGLFHWQANVDGLGLLLGRGEPRRKIAPGRNFLFTPSSVPDGKGVVGVIRQGDSLAVAYVPVDVPLADVVNAWMFVETPRDLELLSSRGGMLRATQDRHLHVLYESESYACDGYSRNTPTRPYLVTTDAFWEVMSAAYEGLFVLAEKRVAIPAFWAFIAEAEAHFRNRLPSSAWARIFSALRDLGAGRADAEGEVRRIEAASGPAFSSAIGHEVDFRELAPRGHYASDPDFEKYFRAFFYLTRLAMHPRGLPAGQFHHLDSLPASLKQKASAWIQPYSPFIAGSREPTPWSSARFRAPPYRKHATQARLPFPLGWGIDNEILNSTVYHADWPEQDRITGPLGPRLLPSALDIPVALGNPLAKSLLKEELARYPRLGPVLKDLGARPWKPSGGDTLNLYARWMQALAGQWGPVKAPGNSRDWAAWDAKRLQTGLASWATLRHATVLVNQTASAECGEGGFEEILMRPPRGYVEPDPVTFRNLAGLFRTASAHLSGSSWMGPPQGNPQAASEQLRKGLVGRLGESARMADGFAHMAAKELRGEALSDADYAAILAVGRVVEHHFLVYKALANKDLGLVEPDPVPKVAEVASSPLGSRYLHAAVGSPMEWDQIVPYFGRRQVVKGAVYSFHEVKSDTLLDDKAWRSMVSRREPLPWIMPYLSPKLLACPPRSPF